MLYNSVHSNQPRQTFHRFLTMKLKLFIISNSLGITLSMRPWTLDSDHTWVTGLSHAHTCTVVTLTSMHLLLSFNWQMLSMESENCLFCFCKYFLVNNFILQSNVHMPWVPEVFQWKPANQQRSHDNET